MIRMYKPLVVVSLIAILVSLVASMFLPREAAAIPQVRREFPRPFGVQINTRFDPTEMVDTLPDLGVTWTRVSLYWNALEPTLQDPPVYNWAWSDLMFSRAHALGVNVLVTIRENPDWAAARRCGPLYPDKMDRYQEFLRALVNRYKVAPYNVHYWEIMNEPDNIDYAHHSDLGGCFGMQDPEPKAGQVDRRRLYVNLLHAAYTAIKGADPQAKVLYGGVAHDYFYLIEQDGLFDYYFLYWTIGQYRGGDYFDIMNSHAYGEWTGLWEGKNDCRDGKMDVLAKLHCLRHDLQQYNYPDKPIWFTETGIRNYSDDHPEINNPNSQAGYVFKLYARLMSEMDAPIFWFTLKDFPPARGQPHWYAGLINEEGEKMPSYYAYRLMTSMMTNAQFVGNTPNFGNTMEGYVYDLHGKRTWIIWYKRPADSSYTSYKVGITAFNPLKVMSFDGHDMQVQVIRDGDEGDLDGKVNGSIRIDIPWDMPLFLQQWEADTPTPTATDTPTVTPTNTLTPTATSALTLTMTITPTGTVTSTVAGTPTVTPTDTLTPTATSTLTLTMTITPTGTVTSTVTGTPTVWLTDTPLPFQFYLPVLLHP